MFKSRSRHFQILRDKNLSSIFILQTQENNNKISDNYNFNSDEVYIKDEIRMINDFIEFKFFKKIMSKKNKSE